MNSHSTGIPVPSRQASLDFPNTLRHYKPFISNIASRYSRFYGEDYRDDFIQEAYIALWKAYIKFNHDYGVPFEHYAKAAISNSQKKLLVSLQSESKRYHQVNDTSGFTDLDEPLTSIPNEPLSTFYTDPEYLVGVNEAKSHFDVIKEKLQNNKKAIFEKIFRQGMSVTEVARELGVSHQAISKQYRQIEALIQESVASLIVA